jgi:hypothetical protein
MSHGELSETLYRQDKPTAFAGWSPGYFARLNSDAADFLLLDPDRSCLSRQRMK